MGENRLPHCPAQPCRGQRTADDIPKRDLKRALDLPKPRERMPWIPFVQRHAVNRETAPPVGEELIVEAPSRRVGLLAPESRLVEFRIAALIEQLQRRVLVERQI